MFLFQVRMLHLNFYNYFFNIVNPHSLFFIQTDHTHITDTTTTTIDTMLSSDSDLVCARLSDYFPSELFRSQRNPLQR